MVMVDQPKTTRKQHPFSMVNMLRVPGPCRLFIQILKEASFKWWSDDAPRLAAAVAFYTMISLAPLVVVAVAMAGFIFGQAAVQGQIVVHTQALIGTQAARVIQNVIQHAQASRSGFFAGAIGVVLLLMGATAVFSEVQHALNTVWEVRSTGGLANALRNRLLSFLMVVGISLLLLAALLANAASAVVAAYVGDGIPALRQLFFLLNTVLPFVLMTALIAMFYRVLPDVKITWQDVWVGALITSVLFMGGKYLLGAYFSRATLGSAYGTAGSLIVFLLWIYYSAQIFLFGAEITHAFARHLGTAITPARGAIAISHAKEGAQEK